MLRIVGNDFGATLMESSGRGNDEPLTETRTKSFSRQISMEMFVIQVSESELANLLTQFAEQLPGAGQFLL
jgi:hypothetical protein